MQEMYYLGKYLETQQAIIIFMMAQLKKIHTEAKNPG